MSNTGQTDFVNSLKEISAKVLPALKGISSKIPFIKDPKVALIAGVAIVVVVFMLLAGGGGGDKKPAIAFVEGETYILKNPNQGKLILTAVPSLESTSVFEGKETDDSGCMVDPGTRATYIQQTVTGYIHYIKVKPVEGKCQDRAGWTAAVNVKEQSAAKN